MKALFFLLILFPSFRVGAQSESFELRIYHFADAKSTAGTEQFIQNALLPALHQQGIFRIGVFKPAAKDTIHKNSLYVLIPYKDLNQMDKVSAALWNDQAFLKAGEAYLNAPWDQPPYLRMETIVLKAFKDMPQLEKPGLKGPRENRIYELRSYEGATEKLYHSKVHMFNEGKEIGLFKRLKFNAIFYAETLAGSRMPNLMYMTSFENMVERDSHWKLFGDDPEWKVLSAKPEYQHTVSRIEIHFLTPTEYSDY
ncbi:MAG: NIPSNAP family protein [Bacteroidetes bacterium]|nr:NIPSNAP family protein [Bacteroidota bacterium]